MTYSLSQHLSCRFFEDGVALFDRFRNDTHFIPTPFDKPIQLLQTGELTLEALTEQLERAGAFPQTDTTWADALETFLEQAINSHLILKDDLQ